jgi:hypothetical protein
MENMGGPFVAAMASESEICLGAHLLEPRRMLEGRCFDGQEHKEHP